MRNIFECVKLFFGALWEMRTAEEARQYDYDCGNGEVEE